MKKILGFLVIASSGHVFAESEIQSVEDKQAKKHVVMEEVLVTGGKEALQTLSGSGHLIEPETLETFDYTDLNQVISYVPGVYVRQEDGYGLRPNIGIRGATSDRSQKITLMEDGVLISPAPYSAPAAYYVPNVTRMGAVEVLKGPAAILHGPHTVGGAINLATKPVPDSQQGEIDVSVGSDGFRKLRAFYGDNSEQFGYWIEGLHYGADGFKDLDGGGDTGFERNDINTKLQWRTLSTVDMPQQFTLKLGFAEEVSDETYLGLTDSDFDDDPYRRYAASQLDKFESDHSQVHLDHVISVSEGIRVNTKLYWNKFNRSWNKFDGFVETLVLTDPSLPEGSNNPYKHLEANVSQVLEYPDSYTKELGIIRGEIDSDPGLQQELIDVTDNDRTYGSHGVQVTGYFDVAGDYFDQEITVGVRYHYDYVERNHFSKGYLMQGGQLIYDGSTQKLKTDNKDETDAFALYLQDKIFWDAWEITAGLRYERIEGESEDFIKGTTADNSQSIIMPGIGVFWQYTDTIGLLAGVNKGFSPAGPSSDADPEETINYEAGVRFQEDALQLDVIGFYSDYSNLLGRCRVSDSGCDIGQEFNGGEVDIFGIEVTGSHSWNLDSGWSVPFSTSYTYTESEFQDGFESRFSQWGVVVEGDELPYLPQHIARVQLGLENDIWLFNVAWKYQDQMRELPGQDSISDKSHTDALSTFDLSLTWNVTNSLLTQLTVDNLLDEEAIVSHRPFGARPNKGRSFYGRVKYTF